MNFVRAPFLLLAATMMMAGMAVPASAQEKTAKEKATPAATPAAGGKKTPAAGGKKAADPDTAVENETGTAAADATQGLGSFGKLLPLNEKNIDVKIPSFTDGKPSSLFRTGSMTRVDDENMVLEKTDIRLYGPAQDKDLRVQLISGTYNMPTQVLSSDERSRVSRADFQIEGDSMIFDTRTQQGKLVGNVQMTIFDTASMMGGTPPQDAAAEPVKDAAETKPDTKSNPAATSPEAEKKAQALEKARAKAKKAEEARARAAQPDAARTEATKGDLNKKK